MKKFTKGQSLEYLMNNHLDLVTKMKDSNHHEGVHLNPYHMEGDVFTHTMMVANQSYANPEHDLNDFWSAMLHDTGKPYVRSVVERDDQLRTRFFGHEGYSFFLSLPILKGFGQFSDDEIKDILIAVAVHGHFRDSCSDSFMKKTIGFENETLKRIINLLKNDSKGRITVKDESYDYQFDHVFESRFSDTWTEHEKTKNITLLIGLPGSGKSTYLNSIDKGNAAILSRDNFVESMGVGRTYSEKWNDIHFNKKKEKALNLAFNAYYNELLASGQDIIIDMTNLTKKNRRKFTNNASQKKYKVHAVVFATDVDTCIQRNISRIGKNVGESVIREMASRFTFPLFDEVDELEVIL